MKRRSFLKGLMAVPAIPVVAKLSQVVPSGPEMTATEVLERRDQFAKALAHKLAVSDAHAFQEMFRKEVFAGFKHSQSLRGIS